MVDRARNGSHGMDSNHLDKRLVLGLSNRRVPTSKQLKHLPRFLSPREKNVIRLLFLAIVAAGLAMAAKFYNEHVHLEPAVGGDYIEASVGEPHFVNPILASASDADLDLVKLVFSGLMKTTSDGQLVPDLAESYGVSEDGKTYTFILRQGVKWHDGVELTSKDVTTTMALIKNPETKSPYGPQFKNVNVSAPDDRTVVFTLAEPFAPFLSMLTVGIVSDHLWQEIRPANANLTEYNLKPIGTGPFKFKNFAKDTKGNILSYTLARNDAYYGEVPRIDTFTFKYYTDFGAAHDALTARKVDGMSFLPLQFREAAEKQRSIRFVTLRLPQYTGIFFNQNKNEALKDKSVRQALASAIDRETLLRNAVGDNGVMVWSPILAGYVGFNPDVKKFPYDVSAANESLEKAGWKVDAETGIRKKGDVELAITLTTVDSPENQAVAEQVKTDWEAAGVRVTLETVSASKMQKDKIRPRDYQALIYGEIIGADPDPYPFWHSSQNDASGLNLAVYSNRRVDELLEKARVTARNEDRVPLYKEFQDILADEQPAILLYSPTYTYVMGRKVKGVSQSGSIFVPADRFDDVTSWYIQNKRVWR